MIKSLTIRFGLVLAAGALPVAAGIAGSASVAATAAATAATTATTATAAAPATPAAVAAHLPPPGLYRVDIDGTVAYPDGATVRHRLPGEGPETLHGTQPGSAPGTRVLPGAGPRTVCIRPRTASGGFDPLAMSGRNGCKGNPATTGEAGMTFSGHCNGIDVTTVVRKLNATTWEMKTRVDQRAGAGVGAGGRPDLDQQRKLFESAAKRGSTPQVRASARQALDHWAEYEAQMSAAASAASEAGAPGAGPTRTDAVVRLTRVGDACKS